MDWSKEELTKLRSNLPTGWKETLAERSSMKAGSVKNILYGRSKNEAIITAALELALEHRETVNAQKQILHSL